MKPNTRRHLLHARDCLVAYFGPERRLDAITAGDADDFRRALLRPKPRFDKRTGKQKGETKLGDNSARRVCGRAKQFFRAALRKRLIIDSPFADMKAVGVQANKSREFFVVRDVAEKILQACPDNQWRLLFALSRFGGLRCPSEHLALRWGDVNWELGRVVIPSPKTEHHEGKGSRVIPIFPELRPHLKAVYDELLEDFDPKLQRLSEQPVITRYRDGNARSC